jgi:hypothetical protein
VGTIPVRIGEDHQIRVVDPIVRAEVGGVANRLVPVKDSGCCRVDDPVATAGHDDLAGGRPHHRAAVLHADEFDRGKRLADHVGAGKSGLVDGLEHRDVRLRLTVRRRRGEPGRLGGVHLVGQLGPWRAKAIEGHVVGDPDRVGTEERATGAIEAGSSVLDWARSSSA